MFTGVLSLWPPNPPPPPPPHFPDVQLNSLPIYRRALLSECLEQATLYVGIGLALPPKIRLILFIHYEDGCFTAVSDNTRPAMSKASLDFGFFCDVNQNLELAYKVFPLCVLSIGTICSLMFFCVMLISLARVSSETHNLQRVFHPGG